MNRDAKTLQLVGEALYGPLWQSAIARDLNVSDRTVRRWLGGDFEIPSGIWSELAELCRKRGKVLERLATQLES